MVYKFLFAPLLLSIVGITHAETCPDFYRFVDFGQTGKDGVIYRGGSFIRAEHFDGTALLDMTKTECLEVPDTNTDGHGYSIPVVTAINYDPDKIPIKLNELRVESLDDPIAFAYERTRDHQQHLNRTDAIITRGTNFLCVYTNANDSYSCQIESPYVGSSAPVVYCDLQQCKMPAMAVDRQIVISAAWSGNSASQDNKSFRGPWIAEKIEQIHNFLSPLSSLNPH